MKRFFASAVLAALIVLISLPALSASGPCPETSTSIKTASVVDGDLDAIVLSAGTSFCVKAAEENSGIQTADGVKTLLDFVTWLNNGGQTPNVSHYVVYPAGTTTSTSSTTSSPTTTAPTTTTLPPTTTTTGSTSTTEASTTTVIETTTTGPTTSTTGDPTTTTASTPVPTTTPGTPEELPYTGFDPVFLLGLVAILSSTGLFLLRRSSIE